MDFLDAKTDGTESKADALCEMCGIVQSPGESDWQQFIDTVEEVEVSWANGDEGVIRRFDVRSSFDLCPACASAQEAPVNTVYEPSPSAT